MSHELPRAVRSAYDEVDSSETGQLTDAAVEQVFLALQRRGTTQQVTAIWSAACALIFPQVAQQSIAACEAAIDALRRTMRAGGQATSLPEIDSLLEASHLSTASEPRNIEARRCLGHALAFCADPVSTKFLPVIQSMASAQQDEFDKPSRLRQRWVGWLDDVVSRSDRFGVDTILDLTARTLRGTLETIALPFRWEGTADNTHRLNVWTVDPRTRKLVFHLMTIAPLEIRQRTLFVTVLAEPDYIRDPLRIEYLFEGPVHRHFLGGMHAGLYDTIDYRCLATGEHWQAPA